MILNRGVLASVVYCVCMKEKKHYKTTAGFLGLGKTFVRNKPTNKNDREAYEIYSDSKAIQLC